jgi:hypothetical protein
MNEIPKIQISSSEAKIKIISSKIIDNTCQRKDCYGNIISKKLKKHKICFPDNLDNKNKIADIHIVTSFSKYYGDGKNL